MLAGVNFTQIELKVPIAHFFKQIQRASKTTQLGLFSSMCLEVVMTVAVSSRPFESQVDLYEAQAGLYEAQVGPLAKLVH